MGIMCDQKNKITVHGMDNDFSVIWEGNASVLEAMNHQGVYFSAVCGGKGSCGKCKIQVIEGALPITSADEKYFSTAELEQGYRLACQAFSKDNVIIRMERQDEEGFQIQVAHAHARLSKQTTLESSYDVAIDIGTTTIAFQLLGKTSNMPVNAYALLNRQRAYGADVISRIQAACEGKADELQRSIREDLLSGIRWLVKDTGIEFQQIERIGIGANTTMGHLLMGYSCEGLGVYPFRPVDIGFQEWSFQHVLGTNGDGKVTLLPGVSTYVGGDITAGLYSCDFGHNEDVCLLVDLGTNGEMAIGNCERIVTTSTAAGPAFEGGNISWGTGSVPGAICHVEIEPDCVSVETIGHKEPVGICGTGVIEIISELVEKGYVDETGRLMDSYFEKGFQLSETPDGKPIAFTQQDIREVQLAKSAVRAGIEVLLRRFGVSYDQVAKVYLAGGFGFHINQEKAMVMGLIPRELTGKIETVGNSSLGGALRYLQEADGKEKIMKIVGLCSEIDLSVDSDFNELYMEHMFFE